MARIPKNRSEAGRFLPAHTEPGPGRDSLYDPAMNDQARKLALLGLTDEEVAEFFGIHVATIYRWKNEYPAFCEALNAGKVAADANVAESLYKRATGEFIEFQKAYKNRETGAVEVVTLKQWTPGDPGAAKLWLTNRQPTKWRDKQAVEVSGKDGGPIQTEDVSAADVLRAKLDAISSRTAGSTSEG